MEANKILSANFLDLVFDNRNKEYGAYELRLTYPERVKKSLLVVFLISAVAIAGAAWANSFKPNSEGRLAVREVTIQQIEPEKEKVIPPPELPKPKPPQQTIRFTTLVITPDNVADPSPTQAEIEDSRVDDKTQGGTVDDGTPQAPQDPGKGTGIIEEKKAVDEVYVGTLDVPARYDGDWVKFLTRNLNAEVPVDHGAPVGRYNVMIQFVVDKEGNLSDIVPLTNFGFGMEEEAVRVLKKAKGWKPGMQHGREVKCYHKQPITFVVEESN
jgi:protein TonB